MFDKAVCERLFVTKLCMKDCVCDKVVCQTVVCVCDKAVGDKVVYERVVRDKVVLGVCDKM